MAMSNVEKQRRFRQRKRDAIKMMPDPVRSVVRGSFFEFYQGSGNADAYYLPLDIAGIDWPDFDDDRDPKSATGEIETMDNAYHLYPGSLGRAQLMVGCLLDAASGLASLVNEFLREELDRAMAQAEQTNPAETARLKNLRDHLAREVRRSIPQWELKGQ